MRSHGSDPTRLAPAAMYGAGGVPGGEAKDAGGEGKSEAPPPIDGAAAMQMPCGQYPQGMAMPQYPGFPAQFAQYGCAGAGCAGACAATGCGTGVAAGATAADGSAACGACGAYPGYAQYPGYPAGYAQYAQYGMYPGMYPMYGGFGMYPQAGYFPQATTATPGQDNGADRGVPAAGGGCGGCGGSNSAMMPGDWMCPRCGDHVFARNPACRRCATPKPDGAGVSGDSFAGGGLPPRPMGGGKGNQTPLPGDWYCPKCKDLQFARNSQCRMCGCPKPESGGFDLSGGPGVASGCGGSRRRSRSRTRSRSRRRGRSRS